MSVTVGNILTLPSFKGAAILAGAKALDKIVLQVSIADSPVTAVDYKVAKEGDFNLSGFYYARENLASMYEFLNILIATNASGLCLVDEYIHELPGEIVEFCDRMNFPVLLNDVNIPYSVMIREIIELLISDGQRTLMETKIDSLVNDVIDDARKLLILREINPKFMNYISVIYVLPDEHEAEGSLHPVLDFFNSSVVSSGVFYKGGCLGFVSYSNPILEEPGDKMEFHAARIKELCPNAAIGISSPNLKPVQISAAINQAMAAAAAKSADRVVYYNDLGIIKLLRLLADRPEFEEFYHEILDPIWKFDEENKADLFETMRVFLDCEYNYKKTAEMLFVHENTVRYRINKVREILSLKNPHHNFIELFSIAVKCCDIKKFR